MFLWPVKRIFNNNVYILIGIAIGFFLSANFDDFQCTSVENVKEIDNVTYPVALKANVTRKPTSKKPTSKIIRPRYYSTELGMRQKLFVGVLTSEEKINTQAIHVNQTVAHLVDKIKFFITTQHKLKTKFNLTGIVGFTDTRQKYRPFQIVKYLGDTFLNEYDYYFLMTDYNYLNARKLMDIITKISVSSNVYLGRSVRDSSFCDFDSGVLISNSVLRAMREHLDWCVINAVSDEHSENFGRCVHYSSKLSCQEKIQGKTLRTYKIKHFSIEKHLKSLSSSDNFNEATAIYPIMESRDFYLLHAYFSKRRLEQFKREMKRISVGLTDSWPPGRRSGSKPATRFDLPAQYYFNATHMFFPDDFTNVRQHNHPDLADIKMVLEAIKAKVLHDYGSDLQFVALINGYRKFDLSRGMDYEIDLEFNDVKSGKEVVKRFEVCKPLGKVEFIPVPYVTENNMVTILLPVQETEIDLAVEFVGSFAKTIMERREKTFLVLVFLYQFDSINKGTEDKFGSFKSHVLKLTSKFKTEESKIIWVSVKLPSSKRTVTIEEYPALHFALIDLALKKIGLDYIVLVTDVYAEITPDFLNRVRMNTIPNFQIFSPIPFRQYNLNVTQADKFEVNKNSGHFDAEEYSYVSFYGKDYVAARKKYKTVLPIVRGDDDIAGVIKNECRNKGNVFQMFFETSNNIHCMRATDNLLKVRYSTKSKTKERKNLFLGSKTQLSKLILSKNKEF